MLLAHVSQEEIGGRGSLPGQEVEGIASDDGLRTLQAAMRRVTGNPKWLRNMNQWFAVWERYSVVAECSGMQTKTQLIHYKSTICQLLELTRKLGLSFQRVVLYDDMFRHQLSSRAMSGDPSLKLEIEMLTIDKTLLEQVDMRLGDVMRNMGVTEDGGTGASGGRSGQPAPSVVPQQNEVLNRLQQQQSDFQRNQKEMLDAIRNGNVKYDDKGKGKGTGKGKERQVTFTHHHHLRRRAMAKVAGPSVVVLGLTT